MWDNIVLIHRQSRRPLDPGNDWVLWKTCLRQIAFGHAPVDFSSLIEDGDEIYKAQDAYRFCLEVVSGLKSRVLGETEVLGQFRDLFLENGFDTLSWSGVLQKFTQGILTDVKTVRQKHLTALGSQSYGSYARKLLKGFRNVDVIGSGQLVESMLPWICKENWQVRLLARNLQKTR